MQIKLRPLTGADKPSVMEILQATSEFLPEEVAVAEEVIDSYLYSPEESGYYTFVAEVDSKIEGFICWGEALMTHGSWDIYWVAVRPEKKGRGIGGKMMELAEAKIREAAGRMVLIETSSKPNYENTRLFYISRGYREICRVPDYYAPGDDKLILQKLLA